MRVPHIAPSDLWRRPSPEPSVLTDAPARQVMRHAIGLLILACWFPLIVTAVTSGHLYGLPLSVTTRTRYVVIWTQFTVAAVVFWWLCWLVFARTPLSQVTPRQRLLQRGAAVLAGAAGMYATAPFPNALAQVVAHAVFGCVLAWLTLEVCRAHRVSLRITLPRTAVERLRDWEITQQVLAVCIAGGALSFLLLHLIRWTGAGVPVMKGGQMATLGVDNFGTLAIGLVSTVALEDVVIVAATTALLTAVRQPAWQIYTLVCVPEVLLHAYLGLPAIGMLVFAAGRVWMYRQYGRLLPFMAAHFTFDLVGGGLMLMQALPFWYRPALGLLFGVLVSWIGTRLEKAAKPVPPDTQPQPSTPDGDTPQSSGHPERVSIQ
ncbi:hypothetical protein OG824_01565 [Streptomyces prunicolor]|uniref:hypothetical protein n=1 Tax=Streptomyces prunicolor TaxID=67348 RepID=UPI002252E49F|nr:hypothetical protein [Streptomyces prunicolor]MCX5233925.1 hypothetical protein [Streptomyces prunicolor]